MRRVLLVVLAMGCAVSAGCAHPPAVRHAPRAVEEALPSASLPRIRIDRVVLRAGDETAIRLEADGTLAHALCAMRLEPDGTVREGEHALLRLDPEGRIVDRDGRAIFTLEADRLVRAADGGAAVLAGERVTFERSPDLALDVERDPGGDDRAVLMTVAALSACER